MLLQNWQRGTTSRRRSFLPGCRLFTVEQEGSLGANSLSTHLHPPKAGFQPYTAPTQPPLLLNASSPALSKDLSALQKVSQLNFAFSSSFSLPSTALQRPPQRNFLGLMRSFSGRGRRSKKDFTIIELLGSQRPPLTPTKLQACL